MSANFLLGDVRPDRVFMQPLESNEQFRALFKDGSGASFRFMRDEGLSNSRTRAYQPFIDSRLAQIREALPGVDILGHYIEPDSREYQDAWELVKSGQVEFDSDQITNQSRLVAKTNRAAAMMTIIDPDMLKEIMLLDMAQRLNPEIPSDQDIAERVETTMAERREINQRIMARASMGSQFAGTAAAGMTDPLVLATLPLGPGRAAPVAAGAAGRGIIMTAMRVAGGEALVGAAAEAAIQFEVYDWKKKLSSPYTAAEAMFNIMSVGIGAGLIRGTGSVVIDSFMALRPGSAALRKALQDAGIDPDYYRAVDANVRLLEENRVGLNRADWERAVVIAGERMNRGESLADLPPIDSARLGRAMEARAESAALEQRVLELERIAEERLPRVERKALEQELAEARYGLQRLEDAETRQSVLREVKQELKEQGKSGRGAAKEAEKRLSRRQDDANARIAELEARLETDDFARKAKADASRTAAKVKELKDKAARLRDEPSGAVPDLPLEQMPRVQAAIRSAMRLNNELNMIPEAVRSPLPALRRVPVEPEAPVSRGTPEAKPKVDKGDVPPDLRAPAPMRTEVPPDLANLLVPVGEEGRLVPLKQALAELDTDLNALQRVDACVRSRG